MQPKEILLIIIAIRKIRVTILQNSEDKNIIIEPLLNVGVAWLKKVATFHNLQFLKMESVKVKVPCLKIVDDNLRNLDSCRNGSLWKSEMNYLVKMSKWKIISDFRFPGIST